MIAALDRLIQDGGSKGVQEIIIGMAHRGRLNVLVNTLGKYHAICSPNSKAVLRLNCHLAT